MIDFVLIFIFGVWYLRMVVIGVFEFVLIVEVLVLKMFVSYYV